MNLMEIDQNEKLKMNKIKNKTKLILTYYSKGRSDRKLCYLKK